MLCEFPNKGLVNNIETHPVLCDNGVGWRLEREGTYVYLQLIPAVVWQKLTQPCKAIILQLKVKKKLLPPRSHLTVTQGASRAPGTATKRGRQGGEM